MCVSLWLVSSGIAAAALAMLSRAPTPFPLVMHFTVIRSKHEHIHETNQPRLCGCCAPRGAGRLALHAFVSRCSIKNRLARTAGIIKAKGH